MTHPELSEVQIEALRVMLLAEREGGENTFVYSSFRTKRPRPGAGAASFATITGEVGDRLADIGLVTVESNFEKVTGRFFQLTDLGRQVAAYHLDDET